jgi:anthraniloyl-CoA monooxygenase
MATTMPAKKIVCIGGGPAGLYYSILMKQQNPDHQIQVVERNRPFDTFGWGVVFSDQTLENLAEADPPTRAEIINSLARWDDIDVHFKGKTITSSGHGFCGIQRKHLLNILQHRAQALGVELIFDREVESIEEFADADLIIACDGINSRIRTQHAEHFQPDIQKRHCRFIWLGTHKIFEAFTFILKKTEWGWFQAHCYRFNDDTSTFIVETPEEVWKAAGIDQMSAEEGIEFCEELFADSLDGNELISNAKHLRGSAQWINFNRVLNERWVMGNVVLMGDAAHTAHFSIGSGTKLALEDAIALAEACKQHPDDLPGALQAYEELRKVEALKLQSAARNSTEWFEHVDRYTDMEAEQFAYALLTRSQRVSHENLRLRDKVYLEGVEQWFAARASNGVVNKPVPPMFVPFKLRDMSLPNRIVMSPMAMYSAVDGAVNDFHLVHFGSRALGGAGLIFTEMTCVTPQGRITPGCAGMYDATHVAAWKRIVDFIHANSQAKVCCQLGHSGPKGSTKVPWESSRSDEPLTEGGWDLLAASALPWSADNQTPRALDRNAMDEVKAAFVRATEMAAEVGFDMIEMHAAHGYLLSAFISPLSNKRTDEYGGSLENRLRYPLEVFDAMRAAWPEAKPMSVRISATDWHPDGLSDDESVEIARMFKQHGVDLMDVSAGQTTVDAQPVYGRMFQTPFSDRIRNEVGIATMAVGNIFETDHANSIIAAGRADLTALARPHLADPFWTLHAAAELKYTDQPWPDQYATGRAQYLRNLERAQEMAMMA